MSCGRGVLLGAQQHKSKRKRVLVGAEKAIRAQAKGKEKTKAETKENKRN
jgi:hypothetical protein